MRLTDENVVLLLCACSAITTASFLQDVCLDKILSSMGEEVCTLIAEYCQFMGVDITEFMDENEVTEFQCPIYCSLELLTETFATCEECKGTKPNEFNENCPLSTNLKIVEDNLVIGEDLYRAMHTLPYGFYVAKSTIEGAGEGVFTQIDLPKNQRFGPYEGSIHDADFDDDDGMLYSWTIHAQDDEQDDGFFFVNALNVSYSNWMRYVNTPNCKKDENMLAVQFQQKMYYIVVNSIKAGSELLVWYGEKYADYLGLDKFDCDTD